MLRKEAFLQKGNFRPLKNIGRKRKRLVLRVLTECCTEYCGKREHHEYQRYLSTEDIDHTKTRARSLQINGICEWFHRTMQDEFYSIAFRKKIYKTKEGLQQDVYQWIEHFNNERTHSGSHCYGKAPMQTFLDSKHLAEKKDCSNLYAQVN